MSDLIAGDLTAAYFCMNRQWLAGTRLTSKEKLLKTMVALYFGRETGTRLQVDLWAKNKGLTSHPEA